MTHSHLLLLDEVPHGCVHEARDDVRVSDDQGWLMQPQQSPLPGQISEMILLFNTYELEPSYLRQTYQSQRTHGSL